MSTCDHASVHVTAKKVMKILPCFTQLYLYFSVLTNKGDSMARASGTYRHIFPVEVISDCYLLDGTWLIQSSSLNKNGQKNINFSTSFCCDLGHIMTTEFLSKGWLQ